MLQQGGETRRSAQHDKAVGFPSISVQQLSCIRLNRYRSFVYFRFHGPKALFASSYSEGELKQWGAHMKAFLQKGRACLC